MKNNYFLMGDVVFIEVMYKGQQHWTQVSLEKLEKLLRTNVRWYIMNVGGKYDKFYVGAQIHGTTVYLHQFVTNPPKGMVVDHINHNSLDNHDANLRVLTTAQNAQNRKGATRANKSSGYRNVTRRGNRWQVQMKVNGKYMHIGNYGTAEEANKVAIAKRKELFPYSTN
jgi:hypothetical protein